MSGGNYPEREKLRSHNSRVRAFAKFENKTQRPIAIEWLDFNGNHVSYSRGLPPGEAMGMNTFEGHPWVFYETECRHRLSPQPGQNLIYFPVAWDGVSEIHYHVVKIYNRLLPLRQSALQALHRHLSVALGHRDLNDFTAKVAELNLPRTLAEDLIELCKDQNDPNIPILPPKD